MIYAYDSVLDRRRESDVYKNAAQDEKDKIDAMIAEIDKKTADMVTEQFINNNVVFYYEMADAWLRPVCKTVIYRRDADNVVCTCHKENGEKVFALDTAIIGKLTEITATYADSFRSSDYRLESPMLYDGWMHRIYLSDNTDSYFFLGENLDYIFHGGHRNEFPNADVLISELIEIFSVLSDAGIDRKYYKWSRY